MVWARFRTQYKPIVLTFLFIVFWFPELRPPNIAISTTNFFLYVLIGCVSLSFYTFHQCLIYTIHFLAQSRLLHFTHWLHIVSLSQCLFVK